MATTERFARLADASCRRHSPGRIRLGGVALSLLLLASSGCAGLSNPFVSSNPYEKEDPTDTGWNWFSRDTTAADKQPLLMPATEDVKRTAMDEKARVDLEAAKRLYQEKQYVKAEAMFDVIAKAKKLRLDTLEDAQFYKAECERLQGNYRDARDNFRVYVQSFPYGKYASLANERMFDIANYWLNATREEMKDYEKNPGAVRWASYNPYNWFNSTKDMPFSDVEGHAVTTLEDVRLNDIRGKLAEKSLFYIATVKFFRGEYKEADFFYSQLVEQHPKSELAEKALKQSIICKQISNGGTAYDTRLVEQCRKFLEEYQRTYPNKDGDWVNKQLVSIHYQQADRDFNVAAFYDRTGHPGSAYFCYELVRRRYPNTEYAKKADARMTALKSKVEEEQRNVKIEPTPSNIFMGIEVPRLLPGGLTAVTAENAPLISPLRSPQGSTATAGRRPPARRRHPRRTARPRRRRREARTFSRSATRRDSDERRSSDRPRGSFMRFAPSATRIAWLVLTLALCAAMTGCASDGHFEVLGYTTRPPFDTSIRTVFVPIFGNKTFLRNVEFEMTKAIIREIEWKSPYKVVDNREAADTELIGTIVGRRKGVINVDPLGGVREAEMGLVVEVTWKDLRSGKTLSVPNGIAARDGFDPNAGSERQADPGHHHSVRNVHPGARRLERVGPGDADPATGETDRRYDGKLHRELSAQSVTRRFMTRRVGRVLRAHRFGSRASGASGESVGLEDSTHPTAIGEISMSLRWKIRDRELDLSGRAMILGIVNVTPDSFSDGGRFADAAAAVDFGLELVAQGADLLDIGGESTRPGSMPVSLDEERRRVLPVLEGLRRRTDVPISVDTSKAAIAEAVLTAGAQIINDVTAGGDPAMPAVVAKHGAGVILMHMQGTPATMQDDPRYRDAPAEIVSHLQQRMEAFLAAGVAAEQIAFDPGIGFGKTFEHNLEILVRLDELGRLGRPICLGVSRKGFLGQIADRARNERGVASAAVAAYCLAHGSADILRVHDVPPHRDVVRVMAALRSRCSAVGWVSEPVPRRFRQGVRSPTSIAAGTGRETASYQGGMSGNDDDHTLAGRRAC